MNETATQRKRRLERKRANFHKKHAESPSKRIKYANECEEDRNFRLGRDKERKTRARTMESPEKRESRLTIERQRISRCRSKETLLEHDQRLQLRRDSREEQMSGTEEFYKAINTFCDRTCEICLKQCYPNQMTQYRKGDDKPYLPDELSNKMVLEVCRRCNTLLRDARKTAAPSKAYWNNLDPGKIPDEINALSEAEVKLLKVFKFPGPCGPGADWL